MVQKWEESKKYLNGILSGLEFNKFESLTHNSKSLQFLTGVSAVELKSIEHSLNNRTLGLSELFDLVSASGVRNVNLSSLALYGNVVLETLVFNFEVVVGPSAEKLHAVLVISHSSDL